MKKALVLFLSIIWITNVMAQQLAFPEAAGFGRFATGGRGGTVYHVSNLHDTGPGSFRDAVSQPKRIIVFDVGGVIRIKDKIAAAPDITIAGQTAPGEGIVVYGNGVSFSGNSIVRYIRFRGSIEMPRGACTVVADNLKNIIFDHVSIEWGRWDNLHIKNSSDVTLQYCLIGEGIDPQRFGALFENPTHVTVHHCLWIDNQSRNPKGKAGIVYANNVIYNWGSNGFVGGHSAMDHEQDLLSNYFIAGPQSTDHFISQFTATDHVYQRGNWVDLDKDGQLNGTEVTDAAFVEAKATVLPKANHDDIGLEQVDDAPTAYRTVLQEAGASLHRDAVDKRLIGYLKTLGKAGQIFKDEMAVGGQGKVKGGKMAKDTDEDGMPDEWEKSHGLNPLDPKDAQASGRTAGYTNIEDYLNEIVVR